MRTSLASRAASAALIVVAGVAAYRAGGAADARPAKEVMPGPVASHRSPVSAAAPGTEAYEVEARLTERLRDARIDVPKLRAGQAQLVEYWRKMQSPWTGLVGDRAKLVVDVALVTSGVEKQLAVPLGGGKVWLPDARKWNMSEGSFDEREAIFAPAPAMFAFALTIPRDALLSFAPAILGTHDVSFAVSVVDVAGSEKEIYARRLGASDAKRWGEDAVDLSAYGGQHVELRLRTADSSASSPDAAPPLAFWGHPALLDRTKTRVPYNLLWIVVDALRPDVIPSFHDDAEDAATRAAPHPPLDALLPRIPGLMPSLDALAARGVRFTHAYSAGAWTRPGTLAMLAGERSSELGVDTLYWPLGDAELVRFYASTPPLLPLLLRHAGVETRAFVNNFFMTGYARVGLDFGFEQLDDERYRTADTANITTEAVTWLRAHQGERFFAFCNYNSPHDPYDPPDRLLARIPAPPQGPSDPLVRRYMAEGAKDDEAVGALMAALDQLGLRDHTLVVVTADHGETLSSAHGGQALLDKMPIRFHHAVGNYEETTRIPILLSLPGVLPEGMAVKARVRNIDLAPTILDVEGLDPDPRMTGTSLLKMARGQAEADERVVVSEGRGTRSVLSGNWRLVEREGPAQSITIGDKETVVAEELYDLGADPGERVNVARARPEILAEMRARLEAAKGNVPVAGTHASTSAPEGAATIPRLALRFAGGGATHRIRGAMTAEDVGTKVSALRVDPVGVDTDATRVVGGRVEVAFTTAPDAIVGFDLRVDPPGAPVRWEFFFDDAPWPEGLVYGGPFGLAAPSLRQGILTDDARAAAYAPALPEIDPLRDLGLFVARERRAEPTGPSAGIGATSGEGAEEMNRVLREWGYARTGSGPRK